MIDFDRENTEKNAEILLNGFWYAELPDILGMDLVLNNIVDVMKKIDGNEYDKYLKFPSGIIKDMKNISSPDYLRSPGVEPIVYYTFKKNQSLREMQIPNLIHYLSFIYNSLWVFDNLFEKLYLDESYSDYVNNSNSYIVFGEEFNIISDYDDAEDIELGVFVSKNNKIQGNRVMGANMHRYELISSTYRYGLKIDIESFFPNVYTHYLEKIKALQPYKSMENVDEYFIFLDKYHQRINNNQTKGIPAGTFSAHVAAELLMLAIDEKIKKEALTEDVGYIRYVDDLTFFSDSKEKLQNVLFKVQKILNYFRLRINVNKNELFNNARKIQNTDLIEIEYRFPWLRSEYDEELTVHRLQHLQNYITSLFETNNLSQIKVILTLLRKKIESATLDLLGNEQRMMNYCQLLVLENGSLASHGYKIIDLILQQIDNGEHIQYMQKKATLIDGEYEDTLIQIWHYFVMLKNMGEKEKKTYFKANKEKIKNPLIISMFVTKGRKQNSDVFKHIVEMFKNELGSGSSDWKHKIMYSRWWLPVYKIYLMDSHDYESFTKGSCFPKILVDLGKVE